MWKNANVRSKVNCSPDWQAEAQPQLQWQSTNICQNGNVFKQLDPVAWDYTRHCLANALASTADYFSTTVHSHRLTSRAEYASAPPWMLALAIDLPWPRGESSAWFPVSCRGQRGVNRCDASTVSLSLWKEHAWETAGPKRMRDTSSLDHTCKSQPSLPNWF